MAFSLPSRGHCKHKPPLTGEENKVMELPSSGLREVPLSTAAAVTQAGSSERQDKGAVLATEQEVGRHQVRVGEGVGSRSSRERGVKTVALTRTWCSRSWGATASFLLPPWPALHHGRTHHSYRLAWSLLVLTRLPGQLCYLQEGFPSQLWIDAAVPKGSPLKRQWPLPPPPGAPSSSR